MAKTFLKEWHQDFVNQLHPEPTLTLFSTKQMKAQREVAAAEGKDHVVVTGDKTKITAPF
jgi:hypothetical protein